MHCITANSRIQNSHMTITTSLLWVISHPVVRTDTAYMCTKFDDFSLSRSSDMIGALKFYILIGYMT